ncbi:MAG: hypothetical protein WC479_06410 [Candidatus Izemoplasmatales bacterium]
MANLFQRFSTGFRAGLKAARSAAPDMAAVSAALDAGIQAGVIPVFDEVNKSIGNQSKLAVRDTDHDLAYVGLYNQLRQFAGRYQEIPLYGSAGEDDVYSTIWRTEPILAGAIYSMSAKMTAMSWRVTGKRMVALRHARMFANAAHMDGMSWDGFLSSTTQDFYTTNRGVFWETPRVGGVEYGKLSDIGHIDAMMCTLTGNTKNPMEYNSETTGQSGLKFKPWEYLHFTSMPSPREANLGIGFCAVSRALRAAKLLIGLHDYDSEKLNNLPPEGVASVSGLTMDEFMDALRLWQSQRKSDNSLTFPQVLWLIGSQPNTEVKVGFQGFSQLPESFERKDVVDQYINTLSMCLGVDAREFWTMSSGSLGTGAESEIQHLKAKGKGSGEFITITERRLNSLLPEDADFGYDTQDIEEDATAATTAKLWIDAFLPLVTTSVDENGNVIDSKKPADHATSNMAEDRDEVYKDKVNPVKNGMPGKSANYTGTGDRAGGLNAPVVVKGTPILSVKDFLRLLADKGVLPDYLVKDTRIAIQDSDIHTKELDGHPEDITSYEWRNGILKEFRIPGTEINTASTLSIADEVVEKENDEESSLKIKRGIKGAPISDDEVQRGAAVTRKTVKAEMEVWNENEELAPHALTDEEVTDLKLKA